MAARKSKSPKAAKAAKAAKSVVKALSKISPIPGSPGGPGALGSPSSPVPSHFRSGAQLFGIFSGIIALVINVYAVMWIYRLEEIDCKCSNSWMRLYIKYYLHVVIPVMVISMFINIYLYSNSLMPRDITNGIFVFYRVFVAFVNFLGFLNIIISIIFINKLKEINCECSEDIKREVYFIYNIVLAAFIGITVLFTLMSIPIFMSSLQK
jgi:hypothetical protein